MEQSLSRFLVKDLFQLTQNRIHSEEFTSDRASSEEYFKQHFEKLTPNRYKIEFLAETVVRNFDLKACCTDLDSLMVFIYKVNVV